MPNSAYTIALAQPVLHIGDFAFNESQLKAYIEKAEIQGADLVIFPELAVCGYPPKDMLLYPDFVEKCAQTIRNVAENCTGIAAVVGGVSRNSDAGPPLYNTAFFLAEGKVRKQIHKTLLPWYDVFDEYRYFGVPKEQDPVIEWKGKRFIVTLCEDLWDVVLTNHYPVKHTDNLKKFTGDAVINIAASPFSCTHPQKRKNILKKAGNKLNMPVFYVNQLAAHSDLIFDGGSAAWWPGSDNGFRMKRFAEDLVLLPLTPPKEKLQTASTDEKPKLQHDALIWGIRQFFEKNHFREALLGLSGGVDSALVYYLAAEALGTKNVRAVSMPTRYTSEQSRSDAQKLVDNLGGSLSEIHIDQIFDTFLTELKPHFQGKPEGVTEENLQSRSRGVVLMALSNKHGAVLLNTTNKSEMAVGYGTLYGDLCGALSVIGDLYKEDVYNLCHYINRNKEIIPRSIIERPPTAELKPNQKDTDSLPPYHELDAILQRYIEEGKSAQAIIKEGFDAQTVHEIIQKTEKSEFKRYQAPPVLRVSDKAFGEGRRIPLVAKFST